MFLTSSHRLQVSSHKLVTAFGMQSVIDFCHQRLSTVFPPTAKLDFKAPPSGDDPAKPFQMPTAIKEKVGEPGEPGRSPAPPAVDQPQIPQLQPVKPPSPPPRPQLVYSHEVGTLMHTTHCVAFKEVVQIFGHKNIFPCITSHCIFEGRVSQHVHRFILHGRKLRT